MGIFWTVYPLNEQMKEYLDSEDVSYPDVPSRFPKDEELHEALSELKGYKITKSQGGDGWGAFIESEDGSGKVWANLQVEILEDDNSLRSIWFEKGHEELIIEFLKNLSKSCGPQALIADAGGLPEVIGA